MEKLEIQISEIITNSSLAFTIEDGTVSLYKKDGETYFEVKTNDRNIIVKVRGDE